MLCWIKHFRINEKNKQTMFKATLKTLKHASEAGVDLVERGRRANRGPTRHLEDFHVRKGQSLFCHLEAGQDLVIRHLCPSCSRVFHTFIIYQWCGIRNAIYTVSMYQSRACREVINRSIWRSRLKSIQEQILGQVFSKTILNSEPWNDDWFYQQLVCFTFKVKVKYSRTKKILLSRNKKSTSWNS